MNYILSFMLFSFFGFALQTCDKADTATASKTDTKTASKSENVTAVNNGSAAKTDEHGHQADDAPRITLADAKTDFDAGRAIFIDTRAADSFKLEHVKGAINIGLGDNAARYKEIPKDKKIIIYCS